MNALELQAWIGREQMQEALVDVLTARRMVALFDRPPSELSTGAPIPAGWHWLYAQTLTPRSDWGSDGHARPGEFLPRIPRTRRMWAGGSLRFHRTLHIGDCIERRSTILAIDEKDGRNGKFLLVRVGHRISGPDGLALEEEQHLAYLPATNGAARAPIPLTEPTDWREATVTDEVLLFFFSALTMNGHRIHYDHPYATNVEGHPGLLVHAPLAVLLSLDAAHRNDPAPVTEFRYRVTAPLICGDTITLAGKRQDAQSTKLWCLRPDGGVAMQATRIETSNPEPAT